MFSTLVGSSCSVAKGKVVENVETVHLELLAFFFCFTGFPSLIDNQKFLNKL
jgi:hypothetical protein